MYFSTVFLLLLIFQFVQLQPIPPPTENTIPFGYKYTEITENFLKAVTEEFKIIPSKKLKMYVSDFIHTFRKSDDICKTNPTPTSPFYELVEESDRMCTTWCRDTNQKYVEFLNKNIYKIKNTLFIDTRFFIIVLNPIDADTGNCVHNKPGKTFNCICNANYQIMVNRTLYVTFLHIVNGALEQDKHTIKREDFSALMILLKFYPRSAVFYLAYLFQKYDVPPKLSTFAPSRRLIINFGDGLVPEDVDGKVEERRQFKEYGNKIYMKVLNLIARGECISNISNDYFNKNNDIEFRDLLITLVTIFKETRDYVQGKY